MRTQALPGIDGTIRDIWRLGGVEVDRVLHCPVVDEGDVHCLPLPNMENRSWHGAAKCPCPALHAARDLDRRVFLLHRHRNNVAVPDEWRQHRRRTYARPAHPRRCSAATRRRRRFAGVGGKAVLALPSVDSAKTRMTMIPPIMPSRWSQLSAGAVAWNVSAPIPRATPTSGSDCRCNQDYMDRG